MKVVWTKPASRHLVAIGAYISKDNEPAAVRIVHRIETAVNRLADHPFLGKPGRRADTRELVISGIPYTVIYRVAANVDVLAVFHQSREVPPEF